jgi:hypothetical protein
MRLVTYNAVYAFEEGYPFSSRNTCVEVDQNKNTKLFLHGNLIAKKENNVLSITNAGWFSNVTKERLNGLTGANIHQNKGNWFLNGKMWDGSWITINTW